MKFKPLSVSPKQTRHTTPDTFLVDQFGKLPDIHGDGELTINEAIRLSKIVNGYSPAFVGGAENKIISGFLISDECIEIRGSDLKIIIPPGTGIINRQVFKIPISIETTWKSFLNQIPTDLSEGRLLIYFSFSNFSADYTERPLPQDFERRPTRKIPEDQSLFNPIKICRAFYSDLTKKIINVQWKTGDAKILISASVKFRQRTNGTVNVWVDSNDRSGIILEDGTDISGNIRYETIPQQGGGYYGTGTVDGGLLSN